MLNDLGLPRDPALRSMEVVKRLKNQGVPWQQRGAQDGQEMSGWTKNPAIPSCQQWKNVGGLTYFTMTCLHFYQIRPPFVRDFESHHCWLRWPTLPKLSCLDEPQVDRTYKMSMHVFWLFLAWKFFSCGVGLAIFDYVLPPHCSHCVVIS